MSAVKYVMLSSIMRFVVGLLHSICSILPAEYGNFDTYPPVTIDHMLETPTLVSFFVCIGADLIQLISPGQNGRHFAGDVFKCIFVNENKD